ncbi:MAG: hypothetical protein L6Q33_08420 [Bacteriovoracaceae bacterium]|nr:hypothetical protein [Bacteriovoracaceae bacterium]
MRALQSNQSSAPEAKPELTERQRARKARNEAKKKALDFTNNPDIIKLEKPDNKYSDGEIRRKITDHVEKSNTAKSVTKAKTQPLLGSGFMDENVVQSQKQKMIEAEAQKKAAELTNPNSEAKNASDEKVTINVGKLDKPSDVGTNDPKDPVTSSKLKSVLDMGAFNFNPKERDVLARILNEKGA